MNPQFSPFRIAVLLGVLSITFAFLWFRIPTVEFCDLSGNPQSYDGKTLRLKSKLYLSMHGGYYFADQNCSEDSDKSRVAISYSPENPSELREIQNRLMKSGNRYNEPVDIVAIGNFTYRDELGNSDAIRERTHLQFEIQETEFIEE